MVWKYTLASVCVLALLTLLKFIQDSPIRSWKAVFLTALPLILVVSWWLRWAYPPPPPPQPKLERVAINRAELERTFRRIQGVDRATINGSRIELNFGVEKSLAEIKNIAGSITGTAAYFLQLGGTNQMSIAVSVRGQTRYEMEYSTGRGIVSERTF